MHISHWKFDIDARSLYFIVFHFMCYYPIAQWLRISRAKRHRWLPCNSRCISLQQGRFYASPRFPTFYHSSQSYSGHWWSRLAEEISRNVFRFCSFFFVFVFLFPFLSVYLLGWRDSPDATQMKSTQSTRLWCDMLLHRLANIICRTNENQRQSKQNQEMKNVGELVTGSRK